MKRLFFSATLLAVITLGMSSCKKKDYTCDCQDGNGVTFETTDYSNATLVDAKRSCDERENVWKNTTQPAANCTIL